MTPQVISLSAAGSTAWIPVDYKQNPFNIDIAVVLSNTPSLTYKVEYTLDDVFNSAITPTAFTSSLSGLTANSTGTIKSPVKAIRLTVTSWTSGTATMTALQGTVNPALFNTNGDLSTELEIHREEHSEMGIVTSNVQSNLHTLLIEPPVSGITTSKTANCTLNFSGQADYNGETVWKITATSVGASQYFEIVLPTHTGFSATDLIWEMAIDNVDNLTAVYPYLSNVGYTRYVSGTIGAPNGATTSRAPCISTMSAYHLSAPLLSKTGFATALGDEIFQECKIRFILATDVTVTVYLRSVGVCSRSLGRIAIVADDGYNSFFDIGVPILREYGLRSSAAIIRTSIGTAGYATLSKLQRYVEAGNECIPHGPSSGVGSGNLFSVWTTNQERLDDVKSVSQYLLDNNLTSIAGSKCYVWPQGVFCDSISDLSFINLLKTEGYTHGRSITSYNFYEHRANAISTNNPGRLILNIVGHNWSSAPGEAANIAAIITKIQAAAADGLDCILMLHKVVGVDAAAASIEISSNQLRALCSAISTLINAGSMKSVLFSDLVS